MADGSYERRGPREAELNRIARVIAETRARLRPAPPGTGTASAHTTKGTTTWLDSSTTRT